MRPSSGIARGAGRLACLLLLALGGCAAYHPADSVTVSVPCSPDIVRVGFAF